MVKQRSRGARLVALVIAATLISGGAAALTGATPIATKIGAGVSIVAGLFFLRIAAARAKHPS